MRKTSCIHLNISQNTETEFLRWSLMCTYSISCFWCLIDDTDKSEILIYPLIVQVLLEALYPESVMYCTVCTIVNAYRYPTISGCPLENQPNYALKVGGNEKQWESGRSKMLGNGLGPWRSRFIYNLNTQLLNKNHISVSALSSKMNKRLLRH